MMRVLCGGTFDLVKHYNNSITNDGFHQRLVNGALMVPITLGLITDALIEGSTILLPALVELVMNKIFGCTKSTFLSDYLYDSFTITAFCMSLYVTLPFYIVMRCKLCLL